MKVLTVILNWRAPEMTLRAAEAALREMDGLDGAITIVDNDSGDGSEGRLRQGVADRGWSEERVRVLQSGRNGGYGAGNNVGIQAGLPNGEAPDLVYVLNPDAIPGPGAIRALVGYLVRNPKVAFAGSLLHGPGGEPHTSAFRFFSVAGEFEGAARLGLLTKLLSGWVVPMRVPSASGPVDWVSGASLMMRRSALDRVGLFDEGFFLYFEETDLCLRAARAGFETHFVRESSVAHAGAATTGMKTWTRVPDYWYDSRLRYFTKNFGHGRAAMATMAHLAGGLIHRLRMSLKGKRAVDPPGFLRRLVVHHLETELRGLSGHPRATAHQGAATNLPHRG
jgi:N-acetylglucosaminyl-diphospho-decaprenol L-rhamnosyltransferase